MLSHEETINLLKLAKEGCQKCKETLIIANSPLIKSVIRRYVGKNCEYDDLFQLGSLGLLKAINNFDSSFGVRFSTYAVPMIAGEVKRFLRDDGSVKVSRSVKAQFIEIKKFAEEFRNQQDKNPTIEQIAEKFNMEKGDVVFAIESNKMPISIYQKVENGAGERGQILMDKIKNTSDTENLIDNIALKNLINELNSREKKIVLLRFFRDKTQSDVAAELNVSQVQVSRIENKILEKLRKELSQN